MGVSNTARFRSRQFGMDTLRLVAGSGLLCLSMSCGKSSSDKAASGVVPYSGFAIAMVAADYSSSQLYFQSLQNGVPLGESRSILTGESGVPWPVTLGETLYFFNRSQTSSNYRTLNPKQADGAPGTQIRTPEAGYGDPHAALLLSSDRLLLAHYTAGKLLVVNPADGTVKQEISATWDLGSDTTAQLRPEAFYRVPGSASQEIYVVHQARKSDFSGFNDSQQLFVLKDDGTELSVVDVDSGKDKIQGIKLHVVNPQIISGQANPLQPIVAGFCTIYDPASSCTSGFERVDLAARTSTLIYDLTSAPGKGNGGIVGDKDGKFYAAVATLEGENTYKSEIKAFDPAAATATTFYAISDANYAAYALNYDLSGHRLYVGEKKSDQTGQLAMFDLAVAGSQPTFLNLPLPPAEIAFVP